MIRKFRESLRCCNCEQCAKVEPSVSVMSVRDRSTICSCWQRAQAAGPTQLKSGGRDKLVTSVLSHPNLRQRATCLKDLDAELLALRGHHSTQQVTSAKRPVPQADDCVWQVDHLQSLTTPPSSLTHNADACFNLDMSDFRVEVPCGRKKLEAEFYQSCQMALVWLRGVLLRYVHKTLSCNHEEAVIVT